MTEPIAAETQYNITKGALNGHTLANGTLSIDHDKLKFVDSTDQTFTFLIAKILIHGVKRTDNGEETELYSQFPYDGLLDEAASSKYLEDFDNAEDGDADSAAEDDEMKFAEVSFTFDSYQTARAAFSLVEQRVRACDEAEKAANHASSSSSSSAEEEEDGENGGMESDRGADDDNDDLPPGSN